MEFVWQISMKFEMSSIQGFPESSFEDPREVIYANSAVVTQWPVKYALYVRGTVWFCGPVVHWWCSRYVKLCYKALANQWVW